MRLRPKFAGKVVIVCAILYNIACSIIRSSENMPYTEDTDSEIDEIDLENAEDGSCERNGKAYFSPAILFLFALKQNCLFTYELFYCKTAVSFGISRGFKLCSQRINIKRRNNIKFT